jgi:hypothetical protein
MSEKKRKIFSSQFKAKVALEAHTQKFLVFSFFSTINKQA